MANSRCRCLREAGLKDKSFCRKVCSFVLQVRIRIGFADWTELPSRRERKIKSVKKHLGRLLAVILCAALILPASVLPAFAEDAADTAAVPRRVTVVFNGDTGTSKGFCWYTDAQTDTKVQVNLFLFDVTDDLTFSDAVCTEFQGVYMHKIVVGGLTSGYTYSYRVGDGTTWSDWGTFKTDNGDSKLNFVAISDPQGSSLESTQKAAATMAAAFKTMPNVDFYIDCGDITNDCTNEEWDMYSQAFAPYDMSTTLVPVAGNHDGDTEAADWFNNMFCLDTSESVYNTYGVNYSFDYGNAHFAVLNSNDLAMLTVSDAQLNWLKNDLNSTDADWKIVMLHKSPYTLGKDAKWPDALYLQDALGDICDECGVDIVMSGHDHMYLRTNPISGGEVAQNGTTYMLVGTAGAKRYETRDYLYGSFFPEGGIAAMVIQKDGYGNYWNGTDWNSTETTNVGGCFSCFSIDGGTLTMNAYILADQKDENNNDVITKIDTMTITKEVGQNTATFDGDNTTSSEEYAEEFVPSMTNFLSYTFFSWLPTFLTVVPAIIELYVEDGTF